MKVLIVDDSVLFRTGISKALEGDPDIEVVGTAANGKIALEKIKQLSPDVIILDLEMPEMDGLTTIKEVRKTGSKVSILVFSDHSEIGARKTLDALSSGADDFLPKSIVSSEDDSVAAIKKELIPKIKQFLGRVYKKVVSTTTTRNIQLSSRPDLILIGCSTGGPDALRYIFERLKGYQGPPILIVQHMPPMFTKQLATVLTRVSGLAIKEAEEGDVIENSKCYIAPGDFHMCLKKASIGYSLTLNKNEKVKSVRPAVDVLFQSVSEVYKGKLLAFILTGMGEDGLDGCRKLRQSHNPQIIIQDQNSSIVWGMPGSVFNHGLHNEVCSLEEISAAIMKSRT